MKKLMIAGALIMACLMGAQSVQAQDTKELKEKMKVSQKADKAKADVTKAEQKLDASKKAAEKAKDKAKDAEDNLEKARKKAVDAENERLRVVGDAETQSTVGDNTQDLKAKLKVSQKADKAKADVTKAEQKLEASKKAAEKAAEKYEDAQKGLERAKKKAEDAEAERVRVVDGM